MSSHEPLRQTRFQGYSQLPAEDEPSINPLHKVVGSDVLLNLSDDAKLLFLCKSIRMFGFGFLSVMLVVYLQELSIPQRSIGLLFSLTLIGDMLISLYLTGIADRVGRRTCLLIGASLSCWTGLIFTISSNYWVLLGTSIVGVISPSGSEVGPFMAIEISSLSQVTKSADCTKIMAWYNLFSSFSSGLGALFSGILILILQEHFLFSRLTACRFTMVLYSLAQGSKAYCFYQLSNKIEVPASVIQETAHKKNQSIFCGGLQKSRSIVLKLSVLFCMDSFAGAFILQSFISAWFVTRYNANTATLGMIVFICNLVAGVSALVAAPLADRIGLILTMAVTHLPSNILIILVPLMPTENWAIAILCARYCISQMDVPTRNAYVQGVVAQDERSTAQGITNVVRTLGAAIAPYIAEKLYMVHSETSYPFFIAGTLKIIYDLLLLYAFHAVKTEHEMAKEVSTGMSSLQSKSIENKSVKGITSTVPSASAPPEQLGQPTFDGSEYNLPVGIIQTDMEASFQAFDNYD